MDENDLLNIDICNETNENEVVETEEFMRLLKGIKTESIDTIEEVYNKGIDLNSKLNRGYTALHYAVALGSHKILRYLCEKGVNIDATTTNENRTALHLSVIKKNRVIISYLCGRGANVDIKDKTGWTVLHYATNENFLNEFYDKSKNLNEQTNDGTTIMHLAIKRESTRIIDTLYKMGASLYLKDNQGRSPYDYAVENPNLHVIQKLHNLGIDLNQKSSSGTTAFHQAIIKNCLVTTEFLYENKFKLDIKDSRGYTALDYAFKKSFETFLYFYHVNLTRDQYLHDIYLTFDMFTKERGSINTIITNSFDKKFLCTFDVYNPHLLMCVGTLKSGHEICFRCIVKLKCDINHVVCFTDRCYTRWFSQSYELTDLLSIPKKYKIKEYLVEDFCLMSKNCIHALNKTIDHVNQLKNENENDIVWSYLERIKYHEDLIDIRIESIKIDAIQSMAKLHKQVEKIKTILKCNKGKIDEIETISKAVLLKFKEKLKEFELHNIGTLRIQSAFVNSEVEIWNLIKRLEKTICSDKVNESDELSNEIISLNINRYLNEDAHDIKFLIQAENMVHDVGEDLKDYDKLENLFSTKSDVRKKLNEKLDKHSNIHYEQQSLDPTSFIKKIENLRNVTATENYLNKFNDFFLNPHPTENELKTFKIIKNGTFDEFKSLLHEDKTMRILEKFYNFDTFHHCSTFLIDAVYYENYEVVQYLIEQGSDINMLDASGRTLIQMAALNNSSSKMIEFLLSIGCTFGSEILKAVLLDDRETIGNISANDQDNFGATLLHYIGARGKYYLLDAIKDIDTVDFTKTDKKVFTCFDRAACAGNVETLRALFEKFKIDTNGSKEIIHTAVCKTLLHGYNIDTLKWLIDLLSEDVANISILASWIGGNSSEIINAKIDLLLKQGANFSYLSTDNDSIIMLIAKDFNYSPTEELLIRLIENGLNLEKCNNARQNIFHIAAYHGNIELLKLIIKHLDTKYLSMKDDRGYTPLMYAIANGEIDTVKWMLPFNLNNFFHECGLTLLDLAISNGYECICKLLRDNGIESTISKYFGSVVKVSKIDKEMFYLHANKLRRISSNQTLNSYHAENLIIKCFKYCSLKVLLEYNIPFHKYIDDNGASALHISAAFGRNDLILWLLKNKFVLKTIDKAGFYALQYCAANQHISTVVLMKLIGFENTYPTGMKPFINLYKFMKSENETFDLDSFVEELHLSVETLKNASNLITKEKINKTLIEWINQ